MYQIDLQANRLKKLNHARFRDHGLRERAHLQEWVAANPEILGELLEDDLLVIQKEFDGFDGTRERLDLLAVDSQGRLVIIENKLDDSGRDVVWQAVKYAAYCSSLKKADIVQIYQRYLDQQENQTRNAGEALCEFLNADSLSDLIINEGVAQRILFIAAHFRREVTSTALWLRDHTIDVRCIKVEPYELAERLIVDIRQVIPPPEAAEYMIRMAEKENEEHQAKDSQQSRHELRRSFWQQALERLRANGVERVQNLSPTKDHWLLTSTGIAGLNYSLVFLQNETRVEFVMQRPDKAENKAVFDHLFDRRAEIEKRAGIELSWERRDERKRASIETVASFDGRDQNQWAAIIDWLIESIPRMENAFDPELEQIKRFLKRGTRSDWLAGQRRA